MSTNQATFTPGPYRVSAGYLVDPRGITIAKLMLDEIGPETAPTNRLLSAAPDLLAALQRCLPWVGKMIADGVHMSSILPNDAVGAMDQAQAAIEKAVRP